MKRKLQLKKETLRTLSAEHLQQVASGSASYDGCDAPMLMGAVRMPLGPIGIEQPEAVV